MTLACCRQALTDVHQDLERRCAQEESLQAQLAQLQQALATSPTGVLSETESVYARLQDLEAEVTKLSAEVSDLRLVEQQTTVTTAANVSAMKNSKSSEDCDPSAAVDTPPTASQARATHHDSRHHGFIADCSEGCHAHLAAEASAAALTAELEATRLHMGGGGRPPLAPKEAQFRRRSSLSPEARPPPSSTRLLCSVPIASPRGPAHTLPTGGSLDGGPPSGGGPPPGGPSPCSRAGGEGGEAQPSREGSTRSIGRELFRRAKALCDEQHFEEALPLFDEVLRLLSGPTTEIRDPLELKLAQADVWAHLGVANQSLGRMHEALASYGRAVALNPELHAGFANLAALHLHLGNAAMGRHHIARALEIRPGEQAYLELQESTFAQGDAAQGNDRAQAEELTARM